ncbi:MAG: sugar phosphate isomerase/epimerase [Eubacteriales bacterium]
MKFGMSTACFFLREYTEDAMSEIGRMGIKNAEVFFSAAKEYDPAFVRELKKRADDYGVNIFSVHALTTQFEPQMFSAHDRQREEAYDTYKRVLEAAAILEAGVYVFHGPANIKIARKLKIDYAYTGQMVSQAAEMAKTYGVKFTYETVHWCWYAKPEFAQLLKPHLATDNLYYTLDIKQAAQSKLPLLDYIDAMDGRLINIHMCDYSEDENKGIIPRLPFEGQLDFSALKTKLKSIDYQGGMIIEVYANNYANYDALADNFSRLVRFFES